MALATGVIIAAFAAMLCWGVGDFLIQRSTRKIGDLESLAFIALIGAVALLPFMLKDLSLLSSSANLTLLLVVGVVTFIVALFDFEALRIGKLSTIDVILELELPMTIVLGYVFFREGLSASQFFTILLVFIGILLIATESLANWKIKWEKGVLMAIIAAIGMGTVNFLTSASSRAVSPLMAIWAPWFVISVLCLAAIYRNGDMPKFVANASRFRWLVLWMGVVDTAAWLFYSFATHSENIGIITAITESYPAVAMFLGIWMNGERINWYQYLGAALAIISSISLAFFV